MRTISRKSIDTVVDESLNFGKKPGPKVVAAAASTVARVRIQPQFPSGK